MEPKDTNRIIEAIDNLTAALREHTEATNRALTTIHADTVVTLRRSARLIARSLIYTSQDADIGHQDSRHIKTSTLLSALERDL